MPVRPDRPTESPIHRAGYAPILARKRLMRVSAFSDPADDNGANEDYVSAAPGLVVVLDGATVRTETGCSHGAAWYANHLGSALSTLASDRRVSLSTALRTAIQHVANQHGECDLNHPGTPSAAVAVLRINGDTLEYLLLGDITIVIDSTDGLHVVVDDRVDATARGEREGADRYPIGSPEKQSALLPPSSRRAGCVRPVPRASSAAGPIASRAIRSGTGRLPRPRRVRSRRPRRQRRHAARRYCRSRS